MAAKPSYISVPGSWHSAETWSKVTTLLEEQGLHTCSVTLPTTSGDVTAEFGDDVKAVQTAIHDQTKQNRDVVLVLHSYGGVVGQSAVKGATERTDEAGRVIGIVNVATGFTIAGMAFLDGTGGQPPPIWRLDPSGFAELQVPARGLFYHDLPEAEGEEWVRKLTKQSSKAFTEGRDITYAGWKDVPVWHVLTADDKALPLEMQRVFIDMVKDDITPTVREVASSHSPMLSRPKELADIIVEAASAFTSA